MPCCPHPHRWDHATGRSRGYGFVSFRHREQAETAIQVGGGSYSRQRVPVLLADGSLMQLAAEAL